MPLSYTPRYTYRGIDPLGCVCEGRSDEDPLRLGMRLSDEGWLEVTVWEGDVRLAAAAR